MAAWRYEISLRVSKNRAKGADGVRTGTSSPFPLSAVRGRKWRRLGGGRFGFIALHL